MEQIVQQPTVIALEGGPCGGKSTALGYIERAARSHGRMVHVLGEAATDSMVQQQLDTVTLAQTDRPAYLTFEQQLLATICRGITDYRQRFQDNNAIIVTDRCDIAAYVSADEYLTIVHALGYERSPHLSLVDTIIYLPTLAHHDPGAYEHYMHQNSARYESAAAARLTCDANLASLQRHPGLVVADEHNFEQRMQHVVSIVLGVY